MSYKEFVFLPPKQTLLKLGVSQKNGLKNSEIPNLLKQFGKNEIDSKDVSWIAILLRQFKSGFLYLLFAACAITFILGEYLDSIFILAFIAINTILGFYQENKSEQTAKFLKKYTNKRASVIRDGMVEIIEACNIVPGDIVVVETGDIIPADLRLIESENLIVDESTLTGESLQVRKHIECPTESGDVDMYKAENIAFSGSVVVEGKGLGVVFATGKNSEFGKITKLTIQVEEQSSFEKHINKFSTFILILTIITLSLVFFVQIFFKHNLSIPELLIFSIALAVGVIPEAMPLVTTFSLSMGASELIKRKVIVKRLSAIEDLGGIQILCTDKTGTITENKLTVSDTYSDDANTCLFYALLTASSFDKHKTSNNAFDIAILDKIDVLARHEAIRVKKIYEIPFSPQRRKNSALVDIKGSQKLIVRGAVENILPHICEISKEKYVEIENWALEQGKEGKRVILIAAKDFKSDTYIQKDEENNLYLLGLISFVDPIKESTNEAVKKAKELGVIVKIVTGDSPEVAGAVGYQIGISSDTKEVITGDTFEKLSIHEQKEVAERINIFARMSPEQKYNLIKILQTKHEVGFLGEGINDAPALKAAGVSIVVDHASDVAREVADIILLKHNLQVIIDGIEQGRKTFVNVTNYIKATLASNFGNFYALAFVTLIIDFLPMLPIQILLVNLLSDFPMISIATDNVNKKDILNPKSYSLRDLILVATLLGLVSTTFDFMTFGIFKNFGESSLQTYWFIESILTELVIIYTIRTRGWFFKVKNLPSKQIIILTLAAIIITVLIPFTAFGVQIFKFITPTWDKLGLVLVIVVGYLFSTEIVKRVYYKYLNFTK